MLIIGLNAFHADSSACLLRDGVLIAAAEEERFRRIKHWAGFPSEAIRWCMTEAGATLADIDHVAINQDSRANFWRKLRYVVVSRPDPKFVVSRLRTRRARRNVIELLEQCFSGMSFKGELHPIEHHLAHLSSAFHVSRFSDAIAVSVDGFGDFASTAWGRGSHSSLSVDGRVHFPHSLGIFYQAITQYLGFPHYGDEYKVMGLAPYGQPTQVEAIRRLLKLKSDGSFALDLTYFRHHRQDVPYQWDKGVPAFDDLFSAELERLLGKRRRPDQEIQQRHKDIARSVQAVYEDAFFNLISKLQEKTGITDLALAGGCANNSVANGKVRRKTGYRRLYVHAAPGDAGGAIGAAFTLWHRLGGARRFHMDHAYWGPCFNQTTIDDLVESRAAEIAAARCRTQTISDQQMLCSRTAAAIAEGQVVGWFEGRMEWGPRALGNRSIVCDPRRADMKQILNAKIKRRESFRPFAPSVLDSAVSEWFEEDDDVPFMMQVFQIREERRGQIPAVTHVDGSGRLQTVYKATNPLYYSLIEAFRDLTGIPMILNTSFNENEPVVCRPEEALDCFLRTQMDVLVLGNTYIAR